MKCAVIAVKLPNGEFDILDVRSNITESTQLYNQTRQEQRIKERDHLEDPENNPGPDYLGVFHYFQPNGRYISKAGFISENEAKEAEKVKRAKAKAVQAAKEKKKAEAEKAKAEKEAAQAKAAKEAAEAKRKAQEEKKQMEAKAVAKAEKVEAKKPAGKAAAKEK